MVLYIFLFPISVFRTVMGPSKVEVLAKRSKGKPRVPQKRGQIKGKIMCIFVKMVSKVATKVTLFTKTENHKLY